MLVGCNQQLQLLHYLCSRVASTFGRFRPSRQRSAVGQVHSLREAGEDAQEGTAQVSFRPQGVGNEAGQIAEAPPRRTWVGPLCNMEQNEAP